MRKTSIYLTEVESARLTKLAKRHGMSQAEIIRRAIQEYRPPVEDKREFALAGVAEGPGGSIADIPEEELLEGFGA